MIYRKSYEEDRLSALAAGRDYWDVELTAGGIYRLFRERRSGDWFADGVYDRLLSLSAPTYPPGRLRIAGSRCTMKR